MSSISRLILDEVHTVFEWGESFRPEYLRLSNLYLRFIGRFQWFLTSAALSYHTTDKVLHDLKMPPPSLKPQPDHSLWLRRSNDRPNLHYVVRRLRFAKSSYLDLTFLIPPNTAPNNHKDIPRFLVYCNSRDEAQKAAEYLRSLLPLELRGLIRWVHAGMSDHHRKECTDLYEEGVLIGLICTDALGMVGPTLS